MHAKPDLRFFFRYLDDWFRLGDPCRYPARPLVQEDVFDKRTAHA